jgi:hypothetical protein
MSKTQLTYDERDVLKVVLRASGDNLQRNLEMWGAWIRETDMAKLDRTTHAQFPLVLLSLMGIHGRTALNVADDQAAEV